MTYPDPLEAAFLRLRHAADADEYVPTERVIDEVLRRLKDARQRLEALRWQVEHEGCAASHLGETTYECRADAPCGLCRLRAERDRLRAESHMEKP